jgi:hypothetical protein
MKIKNPMFERSILQSQRLKSSNCEARRLESQICNFLLLHALWIWRRAPPVAVAAGHPPPGGSSSFPIFPDGGPFKELVSGGCVGRTSANKVLAYTRKIIFSLYIDP